MICLNRHVVTLSWLILVYCFGVIFFTRGFLLKRSVISKTSSCKVNFSYNDLNEMREPSSLKYGYPSDIDNCWIHKRFSKAVLIVIDALRFDFVKYVPAGSNSDSVNMPFHNQLKTIHQLLKMAPYNSKLYQFMADPPTTTMQRLKGLTTGSLPTFVDAGENFASSEINEDNVIDQSLHLNKSIVFMGDDTWDNLFPDRFIRKYSFPSFDVKDLHTVDNGILDHLVPELSKHDWDILIAHFLGVDHCGHRYGPDHPAMSDKLAQMDRMLRSVVKAIDDETILIVLGDHGMTRTGDHGGDSFDELNAAMFVYSKQQLTSRPHKWNKYPSVSQIDLVPTLSLLLGQPIPFSNLGSVIPELFDYCPWWKSNGTKTQQLYHSIKALRLNAHQLRNYIQMYQKESKEFPTLKYAELDLLFGRTEDDLQHVLTMMQLDIKQDTSISDQFIKIHKDYSKYLTEVKEMCQHIWAKFDQVSIILGLLILFCVLVLFLYIAINVGDENETMVFIAACVSALWLALFISFLYAIGIKTKGLIISLVVGLTILVVSIAIFTLLKVPSKTSLSQQPQILIYKEWSLKRFASSLSALDVMSLMFFSFTIVGTFSNSYVVFEDHVTSFFLVTSVFLLVLYAMYSMAAKPNSSSTYVASRKNPDGSTTTRHKFKSGTIGSKFDLGFAFTSPQTILCLMFVGFALCVRISMVLRACREEQWQCVDSTFLKSLSVLNSQAGQSQNIRYCFSIASLVAIVFPIRYWLRFSGNLNGTSPAVMVAYYTPAVSAVCIGLYWALQALPQKIYDSLPTWQIVLLPQFIYVLIVFSLAIIIIWPLSIFVVYRHQDGASLPGFIPGTDTSQLISRLGFHLKENWKNSSYGDRQHPPLVYGLATVFSSSNIILTALVAMLLCLLLGDGLVFSVLFHLYTMFFFLELHAFQRKVSDSESQISVSACITWVLMATHFFYASGHQMTVTTLQWPAAYTGFHGNFNHYIIPVVLMLVNTFASHILSCISVPLLYLWPLMNGRIPNYWEKSQKKTDGTVEKGEFNLYDDKCGMQQNLARYFLWICILYSLKIFTSAAAAGMHQRHLMVWKIFAPKFVFEAVIYFLVSSLLVLTYCFMLRVYSRLEAWASRFVVP